MCVCSVCVRLLYARARILRKKGLKNHCCLSEYSLWVSSCFSSLWCSLLFSLSCFSFFDDFLSFFFVLAFFFRRAWIAITFRELIIVGYTISDLSVLAWILALWRHSWFSETPNRFWGFYYCTWIQERHMIEMWRIKVEFYPYVSRLR